jgi:hypothetical protein
VAAAPAATSDALAGAAFAFEGGWRGFVVGVLRKNSAASTSAHSTKEKLVLNINLIFKKNYSIIVKITGTAEKILQMLI